MEHIVPVTLDAIIDSLASAVAAKLRGDRSGSEPASSPSIAPPASHSRSGRCVYLARSKDAVQHYGGSPQPPVVRDGRRVLLDVQEPRPMDRTEQGTGGELSYAPCPLA